MGSCLGARRRKVLRSVLLKLFSRDSAFIVISYSRNAIVPCRPPPRCSGGILACLFRGRKQKWQCDALIVMLFTAANSINYCEILMKSASKAFGEGQRISELVPSRSPRIEFFEQVMFGYELTKKGKPYGFHPRRH